MPGIKGLHESDNEEVDQDSAESEKSSNDDTESTSASGTDDDDSSEVDEEDCDRRRNECMVDMATLERQFIHLKEQLYEERNSQVKQKLEEVKAGIALDYLQPVDELKDHMEVRLDVARILKELRLVNVQKTTEAEQQASIQNFESEKSLLLDSIKCELEDKIRRLEEDRNSIDITSDLWNEQVNHRKNKRKSDPQYPDKRKKPVAVSGPYIVYMLHESDVLEDWTTIRKALKASKQLNEHEFPPSDQRCTRFADGKLIFKGDTFRKGEHVIVENKVDPPEQVQFVNVNTSEVLLQKHDSSWLRICISDLQTGRYSIRHSAAG